MELELLLGCVLGEVRCEKNVGVEVMFLVSGMMDDGDSGDSWGGGCRDKPPCWRVCGSSVGMLQTW